MNREKIRTLRNGLMIVEEKEVKAVPKKVYSASKAVAIGFIAVCIAVYMMTHPGIMLSPGMFPAGFVAASASVYFLLKRPKKKCVSDIIRNELTESQKEELVDSIMPILADIPDDEHYVLHVPLQCKREVIEKIQSYLEEKLGYREFTSTLPNE